VQNPDVQCLVPDVLVVEVPGFGIPGKMARMGAAAGAVIVSTGLFEEGGSAGETQARRRRGAGPAELANGSWLVSAGGDIFHVNPSTGAAIRFATITGTLPRAVVATADGGAIIARNGGLIRMSAGGAFSAFGADLGQPTCLAVSPDNTLWTAESVDDGDGGNSGRLLHVAPNGNSEVWAAALADPHAIARLSDGSWLLADGPGLSRLLGPGRIDRAWIIEALPAPGRALCLDLDDNAYVAAGASDGSGGSAIYVVSAEGAVVETLRPPVEGTISGCLFTGPDNRTLVAYLPDEGTLVAWEAMPVAGQPQPLFEPAES
jgi:sugar lactone lactonase YvrE